MKKILKVTTDRSPLAYRAGEPMHFTICAFDEENRPIAQKVCYRASGDDGNVTEGVLNLAPVTGASVICSCSRPGFVHLFLRAVNEDFTVSEGYKEYHAGAGADVAEIRYHGNIPDDYDAYWKKIQSEVAEYDMQVLDLLPFYTAVPEEFECFDFKISTPLSAGKSSGFMTRPKKSGKYPIEINYQGYSVAGCSAPIFKENTITLNVNAHGIENGFPSEVIEQKYRSLLGYGFNPQENAAPQTSYWQGVMVRDLVAVRFAKTIPQWNGKDLTVYGGSQGAFQSTVVAANDSDVTFLKIFIPWFCDLRAEENGYQNGWRPAPANGLEYFDTVAAVTRVTCPVEIAAGLGDYCCPPCTTMALYNAANAPKSITYSQCMIHEDIPADQEQFRLEKNKLTPKRRLFSKVTKITDVFYSSGIFKEVIALSAYLLYNNL